MRKELIKAIISGMLITIAGIMYVRIEDKLLGGLLFSFALIVILTKSYNLYTGQVGYLYPFEKEKSKKLGITLLGNTLGVIFTSLLYFGAGDQQVIEDAKVIFGNKMDQLWYETLILGILCGFMMYFAVDGYNKIKNKGIGTLIVIFGIAIFLFAGFEHSIADMVFLMLSQTFTLEAILYIVIVIVGNTIGSVVLHLLHLGYQD